MHTFNFWFLFAPFGVLASLFVGYCAHEKRYAKVIHQMLAITAAVILFVLFFMESYDGAVQFFLDDSESAMADFMAIFAFMAVSALYYALLKFCAEQGDYLNYPPRARKALRIARQKNPNVEQVITPQQIRRALRPSMLQSLPQPEWIDLDQEDALIASKPRTITKLRDDEVEVVDATAVVELTSAQRLAAAADAYEAAVAKAQALLRELQTQVPITAETIASVPVETTASLEEQLQQLSLPDQAIARKQIAENAFLRSLLDHPETHVRVTMVGQGQNRRVRLSHGQTMKQVVAN